MNTESHLAAPKPCETKKVYVEARERDNKIRIAPLPETWKIFYQKKSYKGELVEPFFLEREHITYAKMH
jgi:predicted restriction endonuclease